MFAWFRRWRKTKRQERACSDLLPTLNNLLEDVEEWTKKEIGITIEDSGFQTKINGLGLRVQLLEEARDQDRKMMKYHHGIIVKMADVVPKRKPKKDKRK